MTDLIRRKVIDVTEVKVFVLDEADNMLDKDGLGEQTLRVKKCVIPVRRRPPSPSSSSLRLLAVFSAPRPRDIR